MRIIKKLVNRIDDELHSAKNYAEKYVEYKSKGDMNCANKYKEMAQDEIKHAMYFHDFVVSKIQDISKTITPPTEMEKKWEYDHKDYIERVAYIKQILTM